MTDEQIEVLVAQEYARTFPVTFGPTEVDALRELRSHPPTLAAGVAKMRAELERGAGPDLAVALLDVWIDSGAEQRQRKSCGCWFTCRHTAGLIFDALKKAGRL